MPFLLLAGLTTSTTKKLNKIFRLFFMICAMVFPGAFMVSAQVDAEQVTRIGRNVLAMDDYLLSIQYFNLAIKAKPYLSDPYYYRGVAKLMLDDFRGAEEDCSLAIDRNKFRYEAFRVRGFSRLRLGKDSLAIEDFDEGLKYVPNDKYFLYYKALAQSNSENYDEADSTFNMLMRHYPRFEDGLAAYSKMLLSKGDTVAAYSTAENALRVSPNLLYPYIVKADIEQSKGEWEKAAASLSEALRLEPRETSLYINRAFMRYNADDLFGAMADYNYAIDLDPDNRPAIYNRALLRMQVYDLGNALKDFSVILQWDPDNFPARYNRTMIHIENEKYADAISDMKYILKKYPRFYQGFYTLAEIYRRLGNERLFYENFHKANDIATKYVTNPRKYQLDRPSIEPGSSITVEKKDMTASISTDETELDLVSQINKLITINHDIDITNEETPGKTSKIHGKVQDMEVRAEPQPLYAFTFTDTKNELRPASNFFRELDRLNSNGENIITIYLSNDPGSQSDTGHLQELFDLTASLDRKELEGKMHPADYLTRGIVRTLLKNYDGALKDLDKAVDTNPIFASPLFQRSFTSLIALESNSYLDEVYDPKAHSVSKGDKMLEEASRAATYRKAIEDLDAALKIAPQLSYAWYNKGCIFYSMRNYTDALQCFNEAIKINPDFGNAWYNRALTYMHLGNKQEASAGFSKAGELGVVAAYNLLKRL